MISELPGRKCDLDERIVPTPRIKYLVAPHTRLERSWHALELVLNDLADKFEILLGKDEELASDSTFKHY